MKIFDKKTAILQLILALFICDICGSNTVLIGIDKYKKMTNEQLLNKADSFLNNNIEDSAMMCYSLIFNNRTCQQDISYGQLKCKALHRASTIYYCHCDYRSSLDLLLKALEICEDIKYDEYVGRIYNNIGNVHYQFNNYNSAKKYYQLAYDNVHDKYLSGVVLNNLGLLAHDEGKLDSALYLYKRACYTIKTDIRDTIYNEPLHSLGQIHQTLGNYDSSFYYYNSALNSARKFKGSQMKEAAILHNIGRLHFQMHNYDSAIYYLIESNIVAEKYKLLNVLSNNYLFFSEIEEKRGNTKHAFDYYKQYSSIKDSLFNSSKYSTINELQFMYDMSKIDKHIKELSVEQEIKERTIAMQKKFQLVMGLILIVVVIFLILLYLKNKTINKAYNVLVNKNMEIVNSDKLNEVLKSDYEQRLKEKDDIINQLKANECDYGGVSNEHEETLKYKGSSLKEASKDDLLRSILDIMEHSKAFCDVDFSLNKLADMVGSNSTYVSQIINDSFERNFKTFINEYRVKEARRMLSDINYKKYSIESISLMVGFKSRSRFDVIFREITGITPSFYIRSLKKR